MQTEQKLNLVDKMVYFIQRYYHIRKQFPAIKWLMNKFNFKSHSKVIGVLRVLEHLGLIRREGNQYFITQKLIDYNTQQNTSLNKQKNNIAKNSFQYFIIRIVMAIIGIGAAFMSIYFSVTWLLEYLHIVFAIILGTIMILFSIAAFETLVIFKNNKQSILMIPFAFLWLIVLIFSMVSTVGVLFNNQITMEEEQIEEQIGTVYKNLEWEIYNQTEVEIIDKIQIKKEEVQTFQKLISSFSNLDTRKEDSSIYWETLRVLGKSQNELQILTDELKKTQQDKLDFLNKNQQTGIIKETQIEEKSFYVWISSVTGSEIRYVRFFLYVFPAVFIDLISPLAIAIAMFLKKKKEKIDE